MTDKNVQLRPKREKKHEARVRLFQMLCALDLRGELSLAQPEIESRFEELYVVPEDEVASPESVGEDGTRENADAVCPRVPFEEFRRTCAAAARLLLARPEIDGLIEKNLIDWKIDRMTVVDRALVRLAVFEIYFDRSVNVSVALSEAVLIAKEFSGDESGRFVNGVLAHIARTVRR